MKNTITHVDIKPLKISQVATAKDAINRIKFESNIKFEENNPDIIRFEESSLFKDEVEFNLRENLN